MSLLVALNTVQYMSLYLSWSPLLGETKYYALIGLNRNPGNDICNLLYAPKSVLCLRVKNFVRTCAIFFVPRENNVTRTNASSVENRFNWVQIVFWKLNRDVAENGRVALQLNHWRSPLAHDSIDM